MARHALKGERKSKSRNKENAGTGPACGAGTSTDVNVSVGVVASRAAGAERAEGLQKGLAAAV